MLFASGTEYGRGSVCGLVPIRHNDNALGSHPGAFFVGNEDRRSGYASVTG